MKRKADNQSSGLRIDPRPVWLRIGQRRIGLRGEKERRRVAAVCRTLVAIMVAVAVVWSAFCPQSADAAAWTRVRDGQYDLWSADGMLKLRFDYGLAQWSHYSSNGGGWGAISAKGRSSAFIGDGGWYDLGNSFSFQYASGSNASLFKKGSALRYFYSYASSDWYNQGNIGGWQKMGGSGLSSVFMGDGTVHNLGNGFYYTYRNTVDCADWGRQSWSSESRFRYYYSAGQWQHERQGHPGEYHALGTTSLSASFLGDGAYHDLNNGFSYRYLASSDTGFWSINGQASGERFRYTYTGGGTWDHKGANGSWNVLAFLMNASFIGDRAYHDLGGIQYKYIVTNGSEHAAWSKTGQDTGQLFWYRYASGEWLHRGYGGSWHALGATGRTTSYVGDGKAHDLGNGFTYTFYRTLDKAHWAYNLRPTRTQLTYTYGTGKWEHAAYNGTLYNLGNTGLSAAFMGDGAYHALGNGFQHRYNAFLNRGYWSRNGLDSGLRFEHAYGNGQWRHRGYDGAWQNLGVANTVASFMGDAAYHSIGNGVSYQYLTAADRAYWSFNGASSGDRFRYAYGTGQWDHRGFGGTWYALGTAAKSVVFVGDGLYHSVHGVFSYQYLKGLDRGYWSLNGTYSGDRFRYAYGTGQWSHRGYDGFYFDLGMAGRSGLFIGNGSYHSADNGFWYAYLSASDRALWSRNATPPGNRFRYDYKNGQWSHFGTGGSESLLSATGRGLTLVGDGADRDLGNGFSYRYFFSSDAAIWSVNGKTPGQRFDYEYSNGQWYDFSPVRSLWRKVGLSGMNGSFIGDGLGHAFTGGITFRYNRPDDAYLWTIGTNVFYRYGFADDKWARFAGAGMVFLNPGYSDVDVRYVNGLNFVERSVRPDSGTNAPSGLKDIVYQVRRPNISIAGGFQDIAEWRIHRPGSDNLWSGGRLNVVFCDKLNGAGTSLTDHNVGFAEYTIEDTVVFKTDMENTGFGNLVNWMTMVRDYYGSQISTVGFLSHGNANGWRIGSWVSTGNYTWFRNQFTTLGGLMTQDGQIVSYHCQTGKAAQMLNDVAQWTGCDIFANTNDVSVKYYKITSGDIGASSSVWNHNMRNVYIDDYNFEYKSNSNVTNRTLLESRDW